MPIQLLFYLILNKSYSSSILMKTDLFCELITVLLLLLLLLLLSIVYRCRFQLWRFAIELLLSMIPIQMIICIASLFFSLEVW